MLDAKKLLGFEYFPGELPECFTSQGLAQHYLELKGQINSNSFPPSIPWEFTIYKGENSRRRMALPNPIHYFKIVELLVQNEKDLFDIFEKSDYSLTKPSTNQNDTQKRAYNRVSNNPMQTRLINEKNFCDNTICIKLDISNFFDSIYTHSIPWAIHTKKEAKQKIGDKNLWGNNIDRALRELNDNQTHGILVGNAISRIISEIILCKIDAEIKATFPNIKMCRFVDDYSFYIKENESPNAIISFVRNQLLEYDLVLNEAKTKLFNAPFVLERSGIDEIKAINTHDAYTYYNRLLIMFDKYKDLSLLKYGLSILSSKINDSNFHAVFPLLNNLWVTYPSLADKILPIFYSKKDLFDSKEKNIFKTSLCTIVNLGIQYRQEAETIWAIWSMKLFDFNLNQELFESLCKSNNDLAIIIAVVHMKKCNYKYYNKVINELVERITNESIDSSGKNRADIYFPHWLLIYELTKKNIVSNTTFQSVRTNPFFKKMYDLNVDFFDCNIEPNVNEKVKPKEKMSETDKHNLSVLLEMILPEKKSNTEKIKEIVERINSIVFDSNENWVYNLL